MKLTVRLIPDAGTISLPWTSLRVILSAFGSPSAIPKLVNAEESTVVTIFCVFAYTLKSQFFNGDPVVIFHA